MRSSTRFSNSVLLNLGTTRSGRLFASVGEFHLNSRYDPVREARRFAAERAAGSTAETILILGDTLPYLREAFRESHPQARILSIYYHEGFPELLRSRFPAAVPAADWWAPGRPGSVASYLRGELSARDVAGLLVLEWPPSATAFPRLAAEAGAAVGQIVREAAGEWATEAAFSRGWMHNLFANFLLVDDWYAFTPHHGPTVIAASGPSLNRALPLLGELRSRFSLAALPSSLEALKSAGLRPDLVVAVDGGYWAQAHLHALECDPVVPVAMPLIAARGIWRRRSAPVLLSAGSYIERALLEVAGLAPPEILATGTVAAAAYELSALLSDGPLLFAGLDLRPEALQEHARPHTFDAYLELQSSRTTPLTTLLFDRVASTKASGAPLPTALETYAGWFRSARQKRPAYRLFASSVAVESLRPLDAAGFRRLLSDLPPGRHETGLLRIDLPPREGRRSLLFALLSSWGAGVQRTHRALAAAERTADPIAAGREPWIAELLRSLDPSGYLRYLRAVRRELAVSPKDAGGELLERGSKALTDLRRRYLA